MAEFQPSKLAMRVRFPSPALPEQRSPGSRLCPSPGSSARTEQGTSNPEAAGSNPARGAEDRFLGKRLCRNGYRPSREEALDATPLRADDSRDEEVSVLRGRDP